MLQACAMPPDGESVAGALHKWTNFGKRWRSRWFFLDTRNGSLFYSRSRTYAFQRRGVRLIGAVSLEDHREQHATSVVHIKISSFKESKSDGRRFYVLTAARTLHLRANSQRDRVAWLNALLSIKDLSSPEFISRKLAVPIGRIKCFLLNQGTSDDEANQCEQIIVSEIDLHQHSSFLRCLEGVEATVSDDESFHDTEEYFEEDQTMQIERRRSLPDPIEKEQSVSLWSLIKDNVGKDLTKVCLPVYFNEPISLLQKCFEDLEYSELLDKAYASENPLQRALNVAAFAVSGYASTKTRSCKPFNPLLGETYEANYPEKGVRFLAEKVSHHPTIIACHCEGSGWKLSCDSNLQSKFWGQSIQVNPVGILTLEFADGETFRWSKVTSTIHNVVIGKMYCDHHGVMDIRGNRQYSVNIKFKNRSFMERNRHKIHGHVEDTTGKRVATVAGKWDESLHYLDGDVAEETLLWQSTCPPAGSSRYNLTAFATTLNELTPGLKEKLPLTDSRLRPDQRYLENGEYEKANGEKQRLEKRQRLSRKMQEFGWKPRWFERGGKEGYRYVGGYWEAREAGEWVGCANIFGDLDEMSLPV